ncbi:unnamed protein product [Ambrosiozyma monospora]|uniref:Unnamed protein product n=1 Tax=Ambrosiozyma monospora TaxID=43982 RepID=A0A9W6YSH0_AMBMO|nr:unnamed protein product [Ambrosiozyma monospora]
MKKSNNNNEQAINHFFGPSPKSPQYTAAEKQMEDDTSGTKQVVQNIVMTAEQLNALLATISSAGRQPSASPSYPKPSIKVDFPLFDGRDMTITNVGAFLDRMESAIDYYQFESDTDKVKYMVRHFGDDARMWWRTNVKSLEKLTWEDFQAAFKDRFLFPGYQQTAIETMYGLNLSGVTADLARAEKLALCFEEANKGSTMMIPRDATVTTTTAPAADTYFGDTEPMDLDAFEGPTRGAYRGNYGRGQGRGGFRGSRGSWRGSSNGFNRQYPTSVPECWVCGERGHISRYCYVKLGRTRGVNFGGSSDNNNDLKSRNQH